VGLARMRAALDWWSDQWALVRVSGRSMRPTLLEGDRLLVQHGAAPRVGGLVVVRLPDGVVAVKRVGSRQPDGWWVERDNPAEGVDSWTVGAIPEPDVLAVVRARVWPLVRRGGPG
jgi:phage repressor protein C with HTH and peptisase S24 domain